jgi:recombinational DNA repair protein (RecF pathway)
MIYRRSALADILICARCRDTESRQYVQQEDGTLLCEVCSLRNELKYQEDVMNDPRESSLVRKNARRHVRSISKKIKLLERRQQ